METRNGPSQIEIYCVCMMLALQAGLSDASLVRGAAALSDRWDFGSRPNLTL